MTNYKEEFDRRYFKGEDSELYGTICATCGVTFSDIAQADQDPVFIPDHNNPAHFCSGRCKFNCTHGYCHICYLKLASSSNRKRRRT